MLHFPDHGDPDFRRRLMELEEYQVFQIPPVEKVSSIKEYEERVAQYCTGFEKTLYQHLMQHYLSYRSPYKSLLLYHGLGVGKTCSSITIAESLIADHSSREPARVWVILPTTLQDSYQNQLFSMMNLMDDEKIMEQCTGSTYANLAASAKDVDSKRKRIQQIIGTRYKMMTYDGFASKVEKLKEKGMLHTITNKIIIVDEAHNLRIEETDKRAATALMDVATKCHNNRMVLLSATPMYNEPDEIFWLLALLMANDKRKVPKFDPLFTSKGSASKTAFSTLRQLASEYISYIRGSNPFTFASRLQPSVNGDDMLQEPWTSGIPDGLVPTELGALQKQAIPSLKKSDAVLHQANNVCFPSTAGFKVGKKGFDAVFGRDEMNGPYTYKVKSSTNMLIPDAEHLGQYGSKLMRICDSIRKAHGIVVVYSQFVWGGIIPLAIALEHMGFQRHGATNMLANPEIVAPRATYVNIPFPSYCIISGDPQVMGSASIDDLVKDINRDDNKYGERIKVVLMSPIAGEGLSLRNTREVHVMDPWYHMNRIQQVIGRAIRTCSHTSLPLKERNVTVYLHAATDGNKETMDLHTYKIAARKSSQTNEVERLIRDNAFDCALVKNVHHFPTSLFDMNVIYETSRGNVVARRLGDDASDAPNCALPTTKNGVTMRTETVSELVPTGLQRLRKYLREKRDTTVRYGQDELMAVVRFPNKIAKIVLQEACRPNILFKGYTLFAHRKGYVLERPQQVMKPSKIRVSSEVEAPQDVATKNVDYTKVIASIPIDNKGLATIRIYQSLDSEVWPEFAKAMILDVPTDVKGHVALLVAEGAFIESKELPQHKTQSKSGLIGFVDIFDTKTFHAILWDVDRKMYRDATASELAAISTKRKLVEKPDPLQSTFLFGAYQPYQGKDQTVARFQFKVYEPGPSGGKRTGILCINNKKPDIVNGLQSIGLTYTPEQLKGETKDTLCFTMAMQLLAKGRLFLTPVYKPK